MCTLRTAEPLARGTGDIVRISFDPPGLSQLTWLTLRLRLPEGVRRIDPFPHGRAALSVDVACGSS
jgi:hypothetical protein